MTVFTHTAESLAEEKPLIFTALSARNFHQRMLICRHVFQQGGVPINPFTSFGYYLYELVNRDTIRNANNNLLRHCDQLWVYGDVSDGVLAEIRMFRKLNRPMKYFDISGLPATIKEVSLDELPFEKEVAEYKKEFVSE